MRSHNEKANNGNERINKLPIYQMAMEHEQSVRTIYQSLLTTLQIGLFTLFFIIIQLEWTRYLWVLPAVGVFLLLVFWIPCDYRARNVDSLRIRIVDLVKGTDMEEAFIKSARYGWTPLHLGKIGVFGNKLLGHWFERLLIPFMLIIWAWILICYV